jgi:hypothetical protein
MPSWEEIRDLSVTDFNAAVRLVLADQWDRNPLFRTYGEYLRGGRSEMTTLVDLPFLPISFFKQDLVLTGTYSPQAVFESSGTTGTTTSRHAVIDLSVYNDQLIRNFERVYGSVSDWCILALLPSYLERGNSSLVYMVDRLIRMGGHSDSGFYLNEWNALINQLRKGEQEGRKTLLIGVGFALLDLADKFQIAFQHTIVLETGGMKGRRREWIREELHDHLCRCFGLDCIHSEYGMTELLSQAYSVGNGLFSCPPWMRVLIREEEDPLSIKTSGRGLINVIDLANINSCAFIATDDIGEVLPDGSFRVLGRRDGSDLRGCSLLLQ